MNYIFVGAFRTQDNFRKTQIPNVSSERKYSFQLAQTNSCESDDHDRLKNSEKSTFLTAAPPRFKKHSNRRNKSKKFNKQRHKETAATKKLSSKDLESIHNPSYQNESNNIEADSTENDLNLGNASLEKDNVSYNWLDRHPALLLNADYQPMSHLPLSLWCWQDAVKSVFSGKVTVVDVYPDVYIRAANIKMPLPSVIALSDYAPHARGQKPAFTRKNVFLRDGYRCQYCGQIFRTHELTLDHVKPRCLGGRLTWENAVTCCTKCNSRKGSLQVHELKSVGMQLIREPRAPSCIELARMEGKTMPRKVHPTWTPFLPFAVEKGSTDVNDRKDFQALMNEVEE